MSSHEAPAAPAIHLPPKYTLIRKLGSGGMGDVYLCHHNELDIDLAIKVVSSDLVYDDCLIARFKQEGELLGRLAHDHVTRVYEMDSYERLCFIAMEYAQGKPLRDYLSSERSRLRYFSILKETLIKVHSAITYLASENVVHRDLKPENILLQASTGTVKVLDFGLSKLLIDSKGLTKTGQLLGTPAYMSPEQVQGKPTGPETDMFALGVIAYEVLSGRSPFARDSISETLKAILSCSPPPLQGIAPGLSPNLAHCIHSLISMDPSLRSNSFTRLPALLENQERTESCPPAAANQTIITSASGPEFNTVATCNKSMRLSNLVVSRQATAPNAPNRKSKIPRGMLWPLAVLTMTLSCFGYFIAFSKRHSSTLSTQHIRAAARYKSDRRDPNQERAAPEHDAIDQLDTVDQLFQSTSVFPIKEFRAIEPELLRGEHLYRYLFRSLFVPLPDNEAVSRSNAEKLIRSDKALLVLKRIYGAGAYANLGAFLLKHNQQQQGLELINRTISIGNIDDVKFACRVVMDAVTKHQIALSDLIPSLNRLNHRAKDNSLYSPTHKELHFFYLKKIALK